MKQEATKKPKKLLWLWIGLAALVLIAGAVVGSILIFGGDKGPTGPVGGRPDLYWNLDKAAYTKDSESGLSTREPGEDGVFRVRFAYNGDQVELPIVDKQLVNFIDTMDVMGLVKDADGVVVDVIAIEDIATPVAQNAYVQQVMSDRIIANSSIAMNGMQYTIEIGDLTEMYDVSSTAEVAGQFIDTSAFQAMDSIWVYANDMEEVTHIYMTDHPATSPVYWRAYQMWNSAEKATSRVPDENGVYSIDFCSDGGIVTLKCKDKSIVSSIDNKSPHSCHFGFLFDEEGYIIDIMNSGIGIRGAVAAERIEVTELDGNYFSGSQLIPSDSGLSYSATLPEGCIIYDASSAAQREGRQGQQVDSLKMGDRVCVWSDPMGTPVLVYIANRIADCEGYYNLTRSYDGTKKETKREPDWAGYYTFEMAKAGEIGKKILKTKDKELATFIDSIANSIVGLKVENGIILNAYTDDDVYGWTSVYGGYVPQVQGMILSLVSFAKPDSPTNILMSSGYKAYDISGKDVPYGTETTVRVGDIITVTRDVSSNGVLAYITRRMVDGDNNTYYNLDYQYNSTTKETKRLPDEEGYYVFTMAHKGKQVTVKTKNKELASKIDKSPVGDLVCVMRVVNGIAYELYDTQSAYGQVLRSGYRVKSVNGDGTITVYASNGVDYVIKLADDCIIYNVSYIYDSHRGERCYSIKPGDMVTTLADYRGNAKLIYVRQRCADNIYVNKQRMYDASNKVTLREPDAEGKYWFELAVDGQLKKFWTKNKDIATQADSYTTPFGARIKGDEILNVTGPTYAGKARNAAVNGWDVTSVSKWSIGLQFNKVGYANTGDKQTLNLGSNVKVYDISPTAKQFGEKVELKKGDRILAYSDIDKNVCYIYVLFHDSRVKGSVGYCEHCKKEVKWLPWAGGSFDAYDAHYYLAGNVQYSAQSNLGNQNKDYEIVLDLNGKKYEAIGSRGFLIRYNDTLTILDSVGGGSLAGTGINGNGGTVLMASGGILNLYSGTLSFVDSENAKVSSGAVIYADSSTINVYGGTISGGVVNTSETNIKYVLDNVKIPEAPEKPKPNINVLGGNVNISNSTLNMYGGVIENGQAIRTIGYEWEYGAITDVAAQGGNVYANKGSVVNLYEGAEIRGGYSNQHGGNVFITTSTLNMLGGKIYNGKCDSRGGNLYNQFGGYLNVESGIMENGTAAEGNNVYGSHNNGKYNFIGGTVTGDIKIVTCEAVSVSGTAKITKGADSGLILPSAVDIKLGELKKGAEVFVNASGAFTLANNKAQSYVNAGYIKPAAPRTEIKVENDIMIMAGEISLCDHCGEEVEWLEWPGTNSPASGHYFIGKDFKQVSQISIVKDTDVVIDLYGHKYSSSKIRNFLVRGTLSIMDSVGGGEMVTTCGAEFAGGIALVGTEAGSERPSGFNLYSGTLRLDTEHPDYASFANGGLIAFAGGELNIYGGTMIGGHVTQNGGVIRANGADSVINIMGGTISGGTADGVGGCIYSLNTVNVFGGTVDGEIYIEKGVSLIGGAPVIGELTLAKGALIDINGLEEGASIGVNADGVFTSELEFPADYLQYVHSANSLKDILPVENALISQLGKGFFDKYAAVNVEAEKMTENGVFANGGNVVAVCPACEAEVEWVDLIAYVEETGTNTVRADGHYYLSDNVDLTTQYSFYSNSCLHLNGHNITSPVRAIYVDGDHITGVHSHLNIMGDGIITGAGLYNQTVNRGVIDVGGSVNFYGGTYVASDKYPVVTARGYYGNNVVGTSVVNIYDGAEFIGKDVNLLVRSQAVNVYGGKFTSGTNYVDGASTTNSLNIYGGTFSNDGVVFEAAGAKGTFNITGGTFDGKITIGADLGTFSISGAPVISELDLNSGKLAVFQTLTSGAQIAVNAIGAFTDAFPQAKAYLDAGYIKAANSGTLIREEDGVLIAEVEKIFCEHCGEMVEWKTWPGHTNPVSGHYYIDDDFTQAGQYSIVSNTDVVLDLRGHTYSSTKIRNFLVRGSLSIVDTVGGGQMITTGGKAFAGGIALVGKDAESIATPTFNLYSGTLKLDTENPAFETFANGGLFWVTGAGVEMNVYGGTVIGGNVSQNGGAIKVESDATLNVNGGVITGGTADVAGGCVAVVNAHMTMSGGEVDGDVFVNAAAGNVAISGASKIKELVVEKGAYVDVSGLTTGAQIGVKANGVFTKPLTNANDYLKFFINKDSISVKDDALAVISAMEIGNSVHVAAEKMTADGILSGGDVTANCPVCNDTVTWKDLNALMPSLTNNKITESGHYYLSDDANISSHISINDNVNVCLHLNGHNITSPVRAIYTQYNVVNIMGEGIVTGGYINSQANKSHWASTVDCSGDLNLYGGTYTGTAASAVVASRSNKEYTVSMYEGASIVRDVSVPGLCVMVYHYADFIMYGGSISGGASSGGPNTGSIAGNIYVYGANASYTPVFAMYGGVIENGTAALGGNVYAAGPGATVEIRGGSVLNGSVYAETNAKSVLVSGTPVISDLNLTSGKKLVVDALEVGANIQVTANGAFTDSLSNAANLVAFFGAADPMMEVVAENNALVVRESVSVKANLVHEAAEKMTADGVFSQGGTVTAVCPVCGTEEQWEDLAQVKPSTLRTDKHYYLSKDVNATALYNFTSNACLHLNGHNMTSTVRTLYVEGLYNKDTKVYTIYTLNIMGKGVVTGGGVDHATIPRGTIDIGGNVNLYGGTIVASGNNPALCARGYNGQSVVNIYDGAEIVASNISIFVSSQAVNMYGGKISSGAVKISGVNPASFNVYGGSVNGDVEVAGTMGTLNIAGGEFAGKVSATAGAIAPVVSGAPVIAELDLTSGKKLSVGILKSGAEITVKANNGVFTGTIASADKYVAFFKAAANDKQVVAEGNSLAITNK